MKDELYKALDSLASAYAEPNIKEDGLPRFSISGKKGKAYGMVKKAIDKLVAIEDFEQKLGIDLLTLCEALKQGYVYKRLGTFGPIYKYNQFSIVSTHDGKIDLWAQVRLDPKKYGKRETEGWALTKEELE